MRDFRDLKIWQSAEDLTVEVYKLCKLMPDSEKFGLTSQIKRSSSSICLNIAEGAGKISKKDFNRFIQIAYGSAKELECSLLLIKRLICENVFLDRKASSILLMRQIENLLPKILMLEKQIFSFSKHLIRESLNNS
jgi:four helix bundle protein